MNSKIHGLVGVHNPTSTCVRVYVVSAGVLSVVVAHIPQHAGEENVERP